MICVVSREVDSYDVWHEQNGLRHIFDNVAICAYRNERRNNVGVIHQLRLIYFSACFENTSKCTSI